MRSSVGLTEWTPVGNGVSRVFTESLHIYISDGLRNNTLYMPNSVHHSIRLPAENWRRALEDRDLKMSRKEKDYMYMEWEGNDFIINTTLMTVDSLKYLG